MNQTFIVMAVVLSITAVFTLFSLKQKNDEWEGFLLEKKKRIETDDEGFQRNTFKLIFKTNEGKTKKIMVDEVTFNKYQENKNYIKEKGNYFPKEIQ